jgi:cell wall-associated NlpC family hydrolase
MDLSPYVGLNFAEKGRGPAYDCWGLVALVLRDRLGIDLPSYSERYVTTKDREALGALIAGERGPWREISPGQERALDAVLMTEAGTPCHIGLVARPGLVLHMAPGRESVIEPYTTGKLRLRLAGFFRHESA